MYLHVRDSKLQCILGSSMRSGEAVNDSSRNQNHRTSRSYIPPPGKWFLTPKTSLLESHSKSVQPLFRFCQSLFLTGLLASRKPTCDDSSHNALALLLKDAVDIRSAASKQHLSELGFRRQFPSHSFGLFPQLVMAVYTLAGHLHDNYSGL